jgi:hypothetical protein
MKARSRSEFVFTGVTGKPYLSKTGCTGLLWKCIGKEESPKGEHPFKAGGQGPFSFWEYHRAKFKNGDLV